MKALRQIAFIAFLLIAGHVLADELHINNVSLEPGSTVEVSVELNNPEKTYTLLEFNLSLPEGVSIAKDDDGYLMVSGNMYRLTSSHAVDVEQQTDGSYKFLLYSAEDKAITGTSGEIFKITLTADEMAESGTAKVYNQLFADADANGYEPAAFSFTIEVAAAVPGDVNKDGHVTIADVTALVNIILGKDDGPTPMYDHDAANVNGDDKVTIADVTALVNIILGKN